MTLLSIQAAYGGYGGVDILNGVHLEVGSREIVAIVGPNGAGKSTLMKAIFGLVQLHSGLITLEGRDITNARPSELVPMGLSYVPQERNVFPSLTVLENLEMGAYARIDEFSAGIDTVFEIFPPLTECRNKAAGLLSGGQRQMVAIGRALMVRPRLLLLDEPTAGLSPKSTDMIFERIKAINDHGVSILMVEQNAKTALAMAHQGYVLVMGANRFHDTGPNLLANAKVAQAFLGG
jgi:branched-chain amino acid transport system ATP-binding protein